ncbi:unnamed protein product [Adineta ricciae]|uniref:Uncharacterized protein n=1 Tax=Adineta ricciae TaxID=249248 RepID=A0A816CEA1_ADIRI|nr:unnamed protein product [Adineta ricciae]CAF1620830.1 unnamed protein product [Adineta ricciae]
MPTCNYCGRWILKLSRKAWIRLTIIIGIFFCLALVSFIVFYVHIYLGSLKEQFFTFRTNCTVNDIRYKNRSCSNQQVKTCQLISGGCVIYDNVQNIVLYSTWSDYESSCEECSVDPCLNLDKHEFYINQSLLFIYWSTKYQHGYLKKISKLEAKIARILFIALAGTFSILSLLSLICIAITSIYNRWEQRMYPLNTIHPNGSAYTRPPTIVVQKASNPVKNKNRTPSPPLADQLSSQRLVVPLDTMSNGHLECEPRNNLWIRTLQPLQVSTLSGVVAALRQQRRRSSNTITPSDTTA